jgi:predicted kinase
MEKECRKTLILMRGVPSSGKSYRAKQLANNDLSIIFSADLFFGTTKEEYIRNWNREKLYSAHCWCQDGVLQAMRANKPLVIVDNTNTTIKEMRPYAKMAADYGYEIRIEEPTSSWWLEHVAYLNDKNQHKDKIEAFAQLLTEKNKETHGVPYETLLAMLNRYHINVTPLDLAS